MTRVFRPGVFDAMHIGHFNCIQEAAKLGTHLIVGVQDDRDVLAGKGKSPLNQLSHRMAKISAVKGVDEVISYRDSDLSSLLIELKIDVLAVGEDYGCDPQFPRQAVTLKHCDTAGISVVRCLRTDCTKSVDVSDLCTDSKGFWSALPPTPHATMLTSFNGDETQLRRESDIEAELMRRYLKPTDTVLDLGCGDGRLAILLAKHCKRVHGLDFIPTLIDAFNSHGIANLIGHVSDISVPVFEPPADVIILSGITPCLNDAEYIRVLKFCEHKLSHGGVVLVRASMATNGRVDVINQFSAALGKLYTAYYRNVASMSEDMLERGFQCVESRRLYQHHPDTYVGFMAFTNDHAVESASTLPDCEPIRCEQCGAATEEIRARWGGCTTCDHATHGITYESVEKLYHSNNYVTHNGDFAFLKKQCTTNIDLLRQFKPSGPVLDVGCLEGAVMASMIDAKMDAYGFDVSTQAKEVAVSHGIPADRIRIAPTCTADIWPQKFAAIIVREVIEHIPEPGVFISALVKMMNANGIIQIQTPRRGSDSELWAVDVHLRAYSVKSLEAECKRAGLTKINELTWSGGMCLTFKRSGNGICQLKY